MFLRQQGGPGVWSRVGGIREKWSVGRLYSPLQTSRMLGLFSVRREPVRGLSWKEMASALDLN